MRSYKVPSSLMVALALGVFSSPTLGSEAYCGKFELIGGAKTVTLIDEPPKGDSIGDVRTGTMDFTDPRTNDVVKVYFRSKIVAVGKDGVHTFRGDPVWVFPGGDRLFTADLYHRTNDTRPRGIEEKIAEAVLGGTGAFARVSGSIDGDAGDAPVYRFDLTCN